MDILLIAAAVAGGVVLGGLALVALYYLAWALYE